MKRNNDIYIKALSLAIPMMIQNGITNAVGLIDNLMVGSLGTERMTAVSIVGQLIFVFNLALFGGLSGPGIYGAQYFGQGNEEGVRNIFRLKLWISILVVFIGICTFSLFGDNLINLYLQGEAADIDTVLTLNTAREYLMIMIIGLFPFALTQVLSGSLRETGESIKPMIAGMGSVVTDIVFNYLLIFGKFGCPKMGVKGAAVATVIARVVELGILVIWTKKEINKHSFLKGVFKKLIVPFELSKKVIINGLPIFLNEFLWAGGLAFMTQNYSTRGLSIVAGCNIANTLCNLLNVVFIAMGNAVGIIVGQMLGASDYERAKKDSVKLMKFTGILCAGLTVVLICVAKYFPLLYSTTDEVRQIGTRFIILTALFFPIQGYLNALYFTLRSGGKTIITFLFDSIYTWLIPVPVSLVLCRYTGISIYIIFILIQSADILKVIIGYFLIKKGIWITNLVEEAT
ncbi:MAG: MATE family efflux transporter [Lachnospiraceae bacterium]|nr:MATE family efflux transporter [Lachnospiraceae bacterium]